MVQAGAVIGWRWAGEEIGEGQETVEGRQGAEIRGQTELLGLVPGVSTYKVGEHTVLRSALPN